jgi:predicted neuraminidase
MRKLPTAISRFALGFLLAGSVALTASAQQSKPVEVLSHSVVYVHPSTDPYARDNYYGFNHAPSVVTLPDGRLLAAWFSGPFEASVDQVILASYSSDRGRTWSKAVVLQDFPRKSDFDPAFIADGKRTLFFFSAGRENRYPFLHNEKDNVGVASFKTYVRASDDSGRTWSEPQVAGVRVYCRSNGVRLSSGELLLPIYEIPSRAGVLKSTDDGKTWTRYGKITTPGGAGEPSLTELKSGAVLMILRTTDGFLWETRSTDKGETWSAPVRTAIRAATTSHNIFCLPDGRLLLTLNESAPNVRTPLVVRASADDGQTWSDPVKLDEVQVPQPGDAFWDREVTYPSVTALGDGTELIVWTKLEISDEQQYGDIEAARVRLPSNDTPAKGSR